MKLKLEVCNSFNRAASSYERAARVQNTIGEQLFARLPLLKIQPKYILDLGCGSGIFTQKLKEHYPKAQVVGLDIAYAMLQNSQAKQGWLKKWGIVNADMHKLPFADYQFDLVFSNQALHWSDNTQELLAEIYRVMGKEACFMFSTLGPDTFKELRQAFAEIDDNTHVNDFLDMHDLGDMMLANNFVDSVVDMDILTAHYPSTVSLLQGLKQQGVKNISKNRRKSLAGKSFYTDLQLSMQKFITLDNMQPLTYEVVYGHAWRGALMAKKSPRNTFSVAELRSLVAQTGS